MGDTTKATSGRWRSSQQQNALHGRFSESVPDQKRQRCNGFLDPVWIKQRPWLLAWLATLPLALLRAGTLAETDTFWQIRTGLLTIQQGSIPSTDPFSWTVHGQPWTLNSWGFNVFVALAYRFASLPGAALACAALVAAVTGLVLLQARQLGASAIVAGALIFLASPLLIAWFSARPQLIDYIAVLILVLLLHRLLDHPRAWNLAAIGLLTVVWVNLHAGALLGVAIIAAVATLVLARRSTRVRGVWCIAALFTATAASCLNPYGPGLLAQTAQVQQDSEGIVVEWQHINLANPSQIIMLGLGIGALVVAVRRRNLVHVGALTVGVIASVDAIRILPILTLLALPVLADFASHPALRRYIYSRRVVLGPGAAVAVVVASVMALLSLGHLGRPDPSRFSTTVISSIPTGCRVFNSYDLGGFILLERPDVTVSLDSRNDLYGPERIRKDQQIIEGQGDLDQELTGAGCVVVPPDDGLAQSLHRSPDWQETAADGTSALFVRH
ncbi:hypothetical protein [Sinomonas terrae]|uniref:Glycosyltransferase RgtA/B/C/D-like domain-containing protein n=1 Tax=Sinomonas terrae TaxID=2908838 RepID=A0ABS9TYE0_9MICC|nr:hypothetical protein [Sinomonas terrae]MCH6469365.1 hypothetical protein [Sinomonas terrae]